MAVSFAAESGGMDRDIRKKFDLDARKITDEVFQSKHSKIFDEAKNRMHDQGCNGCYPWKFTLIITKGDLPPVAFIYFFRTEVNSIGS